MRKRPRQLLILILALTIGLAGCAVPPTYSAGPVSGYQQTTILVEIPAILAAGGVFAIIDLLILPFQAGTLIRKLMNDGAHAVRLAKLSQAFAPTMERLAHKLTVDPETGRMDPALARVLRRVVFLKDKRWIEVVAEDGS